MPLVFLLAEGRPWSREELLVARRWLLLASLHGYFSGSSQTKLDQVLKALGGERTPARLWSYTRKDLPKLSDDDFLTGRIGGPTMSLYLSMLREAKARDWGPGLEYLDGTVAGHGSALQVHHFFPRALLKKHKVKASDIDTFANYVVIRQDTNLHAGADEPASYIEVALAAAGKDFRKVRAAIRKQGVPDGPELLARGQLRGLPRRAPDAARRGGMATLKAAPSAASRALMFAILCAARSGEVFGATRDEIDLDVRVWTVPPHRMKMAQPHHVPLLPRRATSCAGNSRRAAEPARVPLCASSSAAQRDGARHGPCAGSGQASSLRTGSGRDWTGDRANFQREVAEAALAHAVGDQTEQAYRRSDALDKRRKLMDAWASFCFPTPAEVVSIADRRKRS